MVDTVGQAILGTTVGCARCHNHKTDKFTQKDYFSLQAFFANTAFDEKAPAKKGEVEIDFEKAQADLQRGDQETFAHKQKAIIDSVREAALKYHKERYLTDSRESIFKPKDQWNALDRWVNHRLTRLSPIDAALAAFLRYAADDKIRARSTARRSSRSGRNIRSSRRSCGNSDKSAPTRGPTPSPPPTELDHADSPPTYIYLRRQSRDVRSTRCSPPSRRRSRASFPTSSRPRPPPAAAPRSPIGWRARRIR